MTRPSDSAKPFSELKGPPAPAACQTMLKSPMTTNATFLFFRSRCGRSSSCRSLRHCAAGFASRPLSLPRMLSMHSACRSHMEPTSPLVGAYTCTITRARFQSLPPSITTPEYRPHPLLSATAWPTLALHAELIPSPTPPSIRPSCAPLPPLSPSPCCQDIWPPPKPLLALCTALPQEVLPSYCPRTPGAASVPVSLNPAPSAPTALTALHSAACCSKASGPVLNRLRFRVVRVMPIARSVTLMSSPAHCCPPSALPTGQRGG